MITIFTPAYNREKHLTRVYESLLIQSDKDFEWIILDDGSNDRTSELIKNIINENKFNIKYIYTVNGGKHRAINIGTQLAKGEWLLFLDSDDWLKENAIYQVKLNIKRLKDRHIDYQFFAIIGLCEYENKMIIGKTFQGEVLEIDYFSSVFKYGITGDKAWAVRTDLLKYYPFPEYEGEKFLTEAIWFNQMASLGYKCRFYNVPIKKVEYQSDGLSVKYHNLMGENWQGTLKYYNDYFKYMLENKRIFIKIFNDYVGTALLGGKTKIHILEGIDKVVYIKYKTEIDILLKNV